MSPDGLLTFLPVLVYPAGSCHCLPEGSSGHIMFFPRSALSVPPCHPLNSVCISQCDIQSFICCHPSWPFYPDLGSVRILLFSQSWFSGISCEHTLYFFHFHTFAWAAASMRTLNFISLSCRICLSSVYPHRSSQSPPPLWNFSWPPPPASPARLRFSPPVFVPLLSDYFPGLYTP